MNVSSFANLFQHSSVFQLNKPLGQKLAQPPIQDALNRLSDNLLSAQAQTRDLKSRFDTLELSAQAADGENSSLSEVPEGILHYLLNLCKVGANVNQLNEAALTEYRDQLSAFDQTIQGYQDMLDGKSALPERLTLEDVSSLLDAAKAAREQFRQQGAEKLNQLSKDSPEPRTLLGNFYSTVTGDDSGGQAAPRWCIDPSAQDIYGEIDRALASVRETASTFQDGAAGIRAELKRRGCLQAGEDLSLDAPGPADSAARRESEFRDIYESIWTAFRENILSEAE